MVNMLKVLIAVVIFLALIGLGILGKKILRMLIFKTSKTASNESLVLQYITGILVAVIAIFAYWRNKPDATITMWIGVLIFFIGGLIQIIARKQLHEDKTFEERLSAGFEAAQTGFYSKIRHPSKTALLLILIGLCLATQSWWGLGLFVVLFFPALMYRISQEERALLDRFGDRWMEYKSDSKRIIPGIF
jgi:protein-S-isoprenylcysteine O-methyltransferase Ste14